MKKILAALLFLVLALPALAVSPYPIGVGGTNNTSFTSNLLLYFNGSQLASFPVGTLNQCILYDSTPKPVNGTCVLAVSAGTGLTLGGTSSAPSLSLTSPVTYNLGGTGQTTAPDDDVLVGTGTAWGLKALPNCADSGGNHLNYVTSTNTFSCGSTSGSSSASHNFLSATHPDTTAASVVRGDVVTGQGSTPKWTRLPIGTQYQPFQAGASEPLYGALHLDQSAAVTGILPIASGGTNTSSFGTSGGCVYFDGTKLATDAGCVWAPGATPPAFLITGKITATGDIIAGGAFTGTSYLAVGTGIVPPEIEMYTGSGQSYIGSISSTAATVNYIVGSVTFGTVADWASGLTLFGQTLGSVSSTSILNLEANNDNPYWIKFINDYYSTSDSFGIYLGNDGVLYFSSTSANALDFGSLVSKNAILATPVIQGHLLVSGTAPTCAFSTGGGTSPSCSLDTGSTDTAGTILLQTGSSGSPGSTGTVTLTFATGYTTNMPVIVLTMQDGTAAWAVNATARISTKSLTAPVIAWGNQSVSAGVTLTTSKIYQINYIVVGK